MNTAPKMLTFEMVLVLRWKICAMDVYRWGRRGDEDIQTGRKGLPSFLI